jgi:hypothetical protein
MSEVSFYVNGVEQLVAFLFCQEVITFFIQVFIVFRVLIRLLRASERDLT